LSEPAATATLRGVLGGTFDPVHVGHLRLALEVAEELGLERVHLVPSARPPHRLAPVAGMQHRLALLERALAGEAHLLPDGRELVRSGASYTVDTLAELCAAHPGVHWCLILGADAFAGLPTWHRWEELTALAHLVVARRPGPPWPPAGEAGRLLAQRQVSTPAALRKRANGAIYVTDAPALEVSATRLRELIGAGRSARFLVPDAALEYIRVHGLYRHGGPA
jgi:nicotinate-nucleotide adenylyltransferase